MPYSTTWEPGGVIWTFWGVVSGDEILRSNQEIYGDTRFDDLTYQIVDLTRVERFEVTRDDMALIAASDKAAARSNPNIRVAVAACDDVPRQLSLFYESAIAGSPWQQRVFDTVTEARSWATGPSNSTPRKREG